MPNKPVPWLKLWPELVDHEKFAQLTDSECWTWVKALAKSGQQPTRGRYQSVQHAVVVTGRPKRHFERLLEVRLMDQREDGLWMHDWEKWQRWRPEDVMADYPSPPDRPPNGLTINTGSTHESLVNGENKTGLRDKRIENRDSPLTPQGARTAVPKPKAERKLISDEDIEELVGKYAERYGNRQSARDEIEQALNHQARFKCVDERLYVDGWLRRELNHRPGWRVVEGRQAAAGARTPIDRTGVAN